MKWGDIFRLTAMQYRVNRLRHILCLGAVAVGVFAMLLLSNIGTFASTQITEMLDTLGLQGMTVFLQTSKGGETLTADFATFMESEIDTIQSATPVKFAAGTYKKGERSGAIALIGAEADIAQALSLEFLYGQGFVDEGMIDVPSPIVISNKLAQELYGRENVVGKEFYLTINGQQERYTVVGVICDQLALTGGMFSSYIPTLAYIPINKLTHTNAADQILFSSTESVETLSKMLQDVAKHVFRMQSPLSVQNLTSIVDKIGAIAEKIQFFFIGISGFSMVVAAFAVLNSMLVAVQEMRKDLLLYRVIGIRRWDIVRLILAQSVGLCLTGTAIGILTGMAVTGMLRLWLLPGLSTAIGTVLSITGLSVFLGIFSGSLPASFVLRAVKRELYT